MSTTVHPNSAPRRKKPSDRYHHGDLRSALVGAAISLLDAGDKSDFSLREAARAVGVTVNATYRHFANKEDLMAAVAAEGFRRFTADLINGAADKADPYQRLLGSGHAYVAFARSHPALFRLMFGRFSASHHGEELALAAGAAYQALKTGVAALHDLDVESAEVEMAATKGWCLAHGLCHLILDGQLDDSAENFDQRIDAILRSYAE